MRIRLSGRIVNGEPWLPSRIAGKRLILGGKGREHMILDSGFTGSIAIQGRLAGDGILREAESEDRPRVWERENTGRRRNIVTAMGSIRLVYDDEGDIPDVDFRWKRIICSVGD